MKGDIARSFIYHPAVLYILIVAIAFMLQTLINLIRAKISGKGFAPVRILRPVWGYILIALIILQWVIKDVLLLLGTDVLPIRLWQI